MNRREFNKCGLAMGVGLLTGSTFAYAAESGPTTASTQGAGPSGETYAEPAKSLPVRRVDVVVAGGGTAGVVAALAAARQGAKTMLIEMKGYTGGTITEGGTALHSFFNLWKAFNVEKRQVVRGIPSEIIDRLMAVGGCSGHAEMAKGYDYDTVCTAIDVEMYKIVTLTMLEEAGVQMALNTRLVDSIMDGSRIRGVICESRSGREAVYADAFVDCTAYGDLAACAGAHYTEPNDYRCANSIGLGNVDIDKFAQFVERNGGAEEAAYGIRSGVNGKLIRVKGPFGEQFQKEAEKITMHAATTTIHDNYLMFIKINLKVEGSVTNRDDMARAEIEIRKNQLKALELFRKYVPGCEKAFIARTSPYLCIRRGRLITCDYDITHEDVIDARHFEDDIMAYGFHDRAPEFQVKNGGTYGIPYRALCVKGIDNLYVSGMMITSDGRAHTSTRNTVSCMGQGQATGTAAALCSQKKCGTRELKYGALRDALVKGGVYFEA